MVYPRARLGPKARYGFNKPVTSVVLRSKRPAAVPVKGAIKRSAKELKFVDIASASYQTNTSGGVTFLNPVGEGSDFNDRDGRSYVARSIQVKGHFVPSANIAGAKHWIALVWDNAANGAKPNVTDIFASVTDNFPNVSNRERFTVLKTHEWAHSYSTTATQTQSDGAAHLINMYCKLNSAVQCNGTASTIDNYQNGTVLLVTGGSNADSSIATLATRFQFTDK